MRIVARRTALSLLLVFAAMHAPAALAADCESRVYDLLQAAYPGAQGETGDEGELLRVSAGGTRWINTGAVICKVWPASPGKTLLAVKLQHEAATGAAADSADLELLVADSNSSKITQRYREAGALDSDAIRISSLSLDTARYRLDDKTTAFGLRVNYSGSSRANPYSSTVLSLYVLDGAKLRPVLRKLEVALDRGEWDTNCAGEFENAQRTVAIDSKRDHGYAGLLVSGDEETRRRAAKGDDCEDVAGTNRKRKARLSYDGREYTVPKELQGL
ncbi:MAG: hypothetical protein ACREP7_17990 [Lysobacter sp.]